MDDNILKKTILKNPIVLLLFCLLVTNLSAQKLIVSEVYWDQNEPENNWIEIYNTEAYNQELSSILLSNVKAFNVLRTFDMGVGKNIIPPTTKIILCASKDVFLSKWSNKGKLLELPILKVVDEVGGVRIITMNKNKKLLSDGFTYSTSDTKVWDKASKNYSLIKSPNFGMSYSRRTYKTKYVTQDEGFYRTEPNPFN